MSKIRVAFIDDVPIFLTGVKATFSRFEDIQVVKTGRSAEEALRIASDGGVDVILMEIALHGNVFAVIESITAAQQGPRVVVLTGATGVEAAIRSVESGASGFLTKRSTAIEVHKAIRAVACGEIFITPSVASQVISALRNTSVRKQMAAANRLSVREEQIARLVLRGRTNKEIAKQLSISDNTVKSYMANLMQKLNAKSRIEVALAVQSLPQMEIAPQ